jgi:hypothetical protein
MVKQTDNFPKQEIWCGVAKVKDSIRRQVVTLAPSVAVILGVELPDDLSVGYYLVLERFEKAALRMGDQICFRRTAVGVDAHADPVRQETYNPLLGGALSSRGDI